MSAAELEAELDTAALVIGMERIALERWGMGDPDGFIGISAPPRNPYRPTMRWNTTEVYRRGPDRSKIIHKHGAFYEPKIAA